MLRLAHRSMAWLGLPAALLGLFLATPAQAEEGGPGFRGWGPTIGMNLDPDQVTVGVMADFGTIATPIGILGFADIGFGDDLTSVIVAPSAVARFPLGPTGTIYGGLSLGLAYYNFDVPDGADDLADEFGVEIDDSSTDFVAAIDFGLIYPLERGGTGLVFDFRIGLVDEHPDFKAGIGYGFGLFD